MLLGISPVTEFDRFSILGSRCGTPRRTRRLVHFSAHDSVRASGASDIPGCRKDILGTKCGTPKWPMHLVVKFEEAPQESSCPSSKTSIRDSRCTILGSACGTPRRAAPVARFADEASKNLLDGASSHLLENRSEHLGSRCGTPRRATLLGPQVPRRALVSFAASAEVGDSANLDRASVLGTRAGTPRRNCGVTFASKQGSIKVSPDTIFVYRTSVLGSRQGTPTKDRQLLRASSGGVMATGKVLR